MRCNGRQLVSCSVSLAQLAPNHLLLSLTLSILLWEPSEGLNPGQALEFMQKRLEMLGGRCQGAWSVDCETLQSTPSLGKRVAGYMVSMVRERGWVEWEKGLQGELLRRGEEEQEREKRVAIQTNTSFVISTAGGQKIVYLLHSSEYPRSTFMLLDNAPCLVAENSLDTIFTHLKQFYAPRKQLKIEAKGQMYLVKQYAVKFGAISVGAGNRGFVVEVRENWCYRQFQVCSYAVKPWILYLMVL